MQKCLQVAIDTLSTFHDHDTIRNELSQEISEENATKLKLWLIEQDNRHLFHQLQRARQNEQHANRFR